MPHNDRDGVRGMASNISQPSSETSPVRRLHIDVQQQFFPELCLIADAVASMAMAGAEARGAVFTRS